MLGAAQSASSARNAPAVPPVFSPGIPASATPMPRPRMIASAARHALVFPESPGARFSYPTFGHSLLPFYPPYSPTFSPYAGGIVPFNGQPSVLSLNHATPLRSPLSFYPPPAGPLMLSSNSSSNRKRVAELEEEVKVWKTTTHKLEQETAVKLHAQDADMRAMKAKIA